MMPGIAKAQVAVHRKPNFFSVFIILPVIFPPANRAKAQRAWSLERFVSAAGAAKPVLRAQHIGLTVPREKQITSPALEKSKHSSITT
jgi:hypothetical protein